MARIRISPVSSWPGRPILDGSAGTTDPNGHGTAMAGIIAALTDNGQGIAGIGYAGVKVMPVTVLDADGLGQDSDIIAGVVWAVDHGADVINMSFSNPGYSASLQAAIDYAWAHNVVVVAATGNDGSSTVTFPAGDRGVIGVSNTDQNDALNASSNYGADTFLGAPGTDIVTTAAGGGTSSVTGTSASAAEVSAAAALLQAADPSAIERRHRRPPRAQRADAAGTCRSDGEWAAEPRAGDRRIRRPSRSSRPGLLRWGVAGRSSGRTWRRKERHFGYDSDPRGDVHHGSNYVRPRLDRLRECHHQYTRWQRGQRGLSNSVVRRSKRAPARRSEVDGHSSSRRQ